MHTYVSCSAPSSARAPLSPISLPIKCSSSRSSHRLTAGASAAAPAPSIPVQHKRSTFRLGVPSSAPISTPPSPIKFSRKSSCSRARHCSSAGASSAAAASRILMLRRARVVSVPRMCGSTCSASALVHSAVTGCSSIPQMPSSICSVRSRRQSHSAAPSCATAAASGSSHSRSSITTSVSSARSAAEHLRSAPRPVTLVGRTTSASISCPPAKPFRP
eukprot:scaffold704_cov347-Prasinococcus_capsulatus_cf.AAC.39